jgi:hypothetical protein
MEVTVRFCFLGGSRKAAGLSYPTKQFHQITKCQFTDSSTQAATSTFLHGSYYWHCEVLPTLEDEDDVVSRNVGVRTTARHTA